MHSVNEHKNQIWRKAGQEVCHLTVGRFLDPLINFLYPRQHFWLRAIHFLGQLGKVLFGLKSLEKIIQWLHIIFFN